jgi:hypothetical protein
MRSRNTPLSPRPGSTRLIKVYLSIIQRKAFSPYDFRDIGVVEQQPSRFEESCNAAAKAFKRKFTSTDLGDLLNRLDDTNQPRPPNFAHPRPPDRRWTDKPDHVREMPRMSHRSQIDVELVSLADVTNTTQPACRVLPYNSRVACASRGRVPS